MPANVKIRALVGIVTVLLCVGLMGPAEAAFVPITTLSFTSGGVAGTATFEQDVTTGEVRVTLTNTGSGDVTVPSEILTALFFDITNVGALTPVSAILGAGSTVVYDPDGQPAGGNVGGEWAYATGSGPGGATEGIGSAGFGFFGTANFNGPDLAPPPAVDGPQYGILSAGDNTATGNTGVTQDGQIKNQVVFTLSGAPVGTVITASDIQTVSFQYGTAFNEPNFPGSPQPPPPPPPQVPAPASGLLLGAGLLVLAATGRVRGASAARSSRVGTRSGLHGALSGV